MNVMRATEGFGGLMEAQSRASTICSFATCSQHPCARFSVAKAAPTFKRVRACGNIARRTNADESTLNADFRSPFKNNNRSFLTCL